jgi:hypothetical protein
MQHSLVAALQSAPPHGTVPMVPGVTPDDELLLLEPVAPDDEPCVPDDELAPRPDDDPVVPDDDPVVPDDEPTPPLDEDPPTTPDDDPGWTAPDEPSPPPASSVVSISERAPQPTTEANTNPRAARAHAPTAIPWW